METSLAPSPTASVSTLRLSLALRTMSAFWRGVARQHKTALHCLARLKNFFLRLARRSKMYLDLEIHRSLLWMWKTEEEMDISEQEYTLISWDRYIMYSFSQTSTLQIFYISISLVCHMYVLWAYLLQMQSYKTIKGSLTGESSHPPQVLALWLEQKTGYLEAHILHWPERVPSTLPAAGFVARKNWWSALPGLWFLHSILLSVINTTVRNFNTLNMKGT